MSGRDDTPCDDPMLPHASRFAEAALAAQRCRHTPGHGERGDCDDEGIGALVVNTGLDGDAASG